MSDEQMLAVYRHDAHKMRGRSHAAGPREIAGVEVNADVPYGADADAAALSRPSGKPQPVVEGHDTHYRLSLITGRSRYDPDTFALRHYEDELLALLATDDAEAMHRAWLDSRVVAAFNEAVSYPYTSLKYHTLLVGALVDCYRNGHGFGDLRLVGDESAEVIPFRTVYHDGARSLHVTTDHGARFGEVPSRSWGSVWSRLPSHPLQTDEYREHMVVDAQLRRIRAVSTALQYLEDAVREGVAGR